MLWMLGFIDIARAYPGNSVEHAYHVRVRHYYLGKPEQCPITIQKYVYIHLRIDLRIARVCLRKYIEHAHFFKKYGTPPYSSREGGNDNRRSQFY